MKIYISFDDGPSEGTPEILDILNKYGIKAIFFVLVENALKYPKLIRRELKEGHQIGLHGLTHKSFNDMTAWETQEQMEKALRILDAEFGIQPIYYRPSYGTVTLAGHQSAIKNNLKLMMWDVMEKDYRSANPDRKIKYIMKQLLDDKEKVDQILCMHDGFKNKSYGGCTAQILNNILPILINEHKCEFAQFTENDI